MSTLELRRCLSEENQDHQEDEVDGDQSDEPVIDATHPGDPVVGATPSSMVGAGIQCLSQIVCMAQGGGEDRYDDGGHGPCPSGGAAAFDASTSGGLGFTDGLHLPNQRRDEPQSQGEDQGYLAGMDSEPAQGREEGLEGVGHLCRRCGHEQEGPQKEDKAKPAGIYQSGP